MVRRHPDPIGGDWASSTPESCEMDCRIGLLPGSTLEDARAGVQRCVAEAARGGAFMANNPPEIIWNGFQADGYVLEPGSEAERVLAAAHQAVFGTAMEERRSTAVNDTRFYGLYHRMPALCYGPRGINVHGFDEAAHLPTLQQVTFGDCLFRGGLVRGTGGAVACCRDVTAMQADRAKVHVGGPDPADGLTPHVGR